MAYRKRAGHVPDWLPSCEDGRTGHDVPGKAGRDRAALARGCPALQHARSFPLPRARPLRRGRALVEWARELPKDSPIEILIHLQSGAAEAARTGDLADAITGWFEARAQAETRALRELFRDGRVGFLIGIGVLALCLLLSWFLSQRFEEPFARVVSESFVIIGWVVIWRPAEIFLYDWLPLVRRRKLFDRLANAAVTVADAGEAPAAS
jgi:hypothetical protein